MAFLSPCRSVQITQSLNNNMGTRHSSIQPSGALIVSNKKISVKEEIIKRKNKTKTGFVLIIAMCCSTVINTVEPEDKQKGQNEEANSESNVPKSVQNFAPKKPLNSRPRVRSYGYRFTRVSPLILSVDDLEDFSKQNGDEELPSPEVNEPKPDFHSKVEQGN